MPEPVLTGRVALVTGVSRRKGIGFAIAQKLAAMGANVFIHSFYPMMPIVIGEPILMAFQH
jgi:3-oxoacyl-[acyl-carrier protein] reductase